MQNNIYLTFLVSKRTNKSAVGWQDIEEGGTDNENQHANYQL